MSVKSMNVYVELDIQAVTCPGVWLCPNGKIALKIFMFESSARTSHLPPVFPLLYHQKFIFQKTFSNVRYLADLQHLFGKEFLYTELVQCSGSTGVVLASFETTVFELLYPSPCVKGLIAGVDVDLLMEPTSCFPGILAPKIEISTKTVIEESIDSPSHSKRNPGIINPKMLSSKKQISNCGKSQYREEFYRDLEKFYKELHKRAKKKTSKDDCLEILRL
ncbi:hypothetical protein ANN_07784 [Periplaneta americana]|uniref:Spermatogenesis-associated protein 6 N-terminal domain-containing protein n=1 Tax=Periplaneta americana TaxID=6978 RepID=A0ABQ8T0V1_PERAM|nr:hypothetical protein ANN_07784 [Periplaneta americana]